jgi:DNA topoisomerase-1
MPPKFFKKGASKKPTVASLNSGSAKYLIIVESPSKCTKIESYLGTDYYCIASKGHIRHLDGLKSIDTKGNFEPTFSLIDEKKDHVDFMRKTISKFPKTNIILATDDDREGEAIAWHICQLFELPVETTPRIIFHEVTKPALLCAIQTPTTLNMNLIRAQHARQVLDVIVGYKISPLLWKYLFNNKSNSLSAGRCQTPALRLVYDNEKEKEASHLEQKYKTIGNFYNKNISFDLNHEFDKEAEVLEFLKQSQVFDYKMTIGSQKESNRSAPKPFHTSRLLQTASNVLHMSPKETMSLCQQLYQTGYITYMRTESSQYSKSYLDQIKKHIIDAFSSDKYLGDLDKLENKDKTNPHEAIRVTHLETTYLPSEDTRLASLYKLIWKNSIESCMSDAKYATHEIQITAPMKYHYKHLLEIPMFLGWKKLGEKTSGVDEQNTGSGMLLYFQSILSSGSKVKHNFIESAVVIRNKHQYYTEASLINTLEDHGIGRPSTFATIVETIQERGYVKKTNIEGKIVKCKEFRLETDNQLLEIIKERTFGNEKNKLVIQSVGILTLEFLLQHFQSIFTYEYTKNMEDKLDNISSGQQKEWSDICKDCYNEIKVLSKPISNVSKQIYEIESGYTFAFDKFGPVIRHLLEGGETEYISVKKDMNIDLEKLKAGEYNLDDLIEVKTNGILGKYEGLDVYIKTGRYGPYVEWGEKKESIKTIKKPIDQVTLDDIKEFLDNKITVEPNILRKLNDYMTVRKGKFGPYVYYKRPDMKKPQFLNIKKFNEGFFACEVETLVKWLCETYSLPEP